MVRQLGERFGLVLCHRPEDVPELVLEVRLKS